MSQILRDLRDALQEAERAGLKVAMFNHHHRHGTDPIIVLHDELPENLPAALEAIDPDLFEFRRDDEYLDEVSGIGVYNLSARQP